MALQNLCSVHLLKMLGRVAAQQRWKMRLYQAWGGFRLLYPQQDTQKMIGVNTDLLRGHTLYTFLQLWFSTFQSWDCSEC